MGDSGDYWREHKSYQRRMKDKHEENCARGKHAWAQKVHGTGEECIWCYEEKPEGADKKGD